MTLSSIPHFFADIVEQEHELTIRDLCRICTVEREHIVGLVEEGIIEATRDSSGEWHFRGDSLRRARLALRLQRDLELNLAGVALAVELLEEREQLRRALLARGAR